MCDMQRFMATREQLGKPVIALSFYNCCISTLLDGFLTPSLQHLEINNCKLSRLDLAAVDQHLRTTKSRALLHVGIRNTPLWENMDRLHPLKENKHLQTLAIHYKAFTLVDLRAWWRPQHHHVYNFAASLHRHFYCILLSCQRGHQARLPSEITNYIFGFYKLLDQ